MPEGSITAHFNSYILEPKDYSGPYLFGGPKFLETARRAGYPEYMLKLTKPIPRTDEDFS